MLFEVCFSEESATSQARARREEDILRAPFFPRNYRAAFAVLGRVSSLGQILSSLARRGPAQNSGYISEATFSMVNASFSSRAQGLQGSSGQREAVQRFSAQVQRRIAVRRTPGDHG